MRTCDVIRFLNRAVAVPKWQGTEGTALSCLYPVIRAVEWLPQVGCFGIGYVLLLATCPKNPRVEFPRCHKASTFSSRASAWEPALCPGKHPCWLLKGCLLPPGTGGGKQLLGSSMSLVPCECRRPVWLLSLELSSQSPFRTDFKSTRTVLGPSKTGTGGHSSFGLLFPSKTASPGMEAGEAAGG